MAFLRYSMLAMLLFCITAEGVTYNSIGNYCDFVHDEPSIPTIRKVLANLASLSTQDGFGTTSYGEGRNKYYGLYQCRGDISRKNCSKCIHDAAKEIRDTCPDRVYGKIWYDVCFLGYEDENFFGKVDTFPDIVYANDDSVPDPGFFNKKLAQLTEQISAEAIVPKNKGLGKGKTALSPSRTLYALVQCTRDLSALDCAKCIAISVAKFDADCKNKKGCLILYGSCYLRYDLYPFYS